MSDMSQDWERLAKAIRGARKARRWTQRDLAREAGMGFSTVQRLESGAGYETMPLTIDKVERALGWAPGGAVAILAGGDPTPLADASAVIGKVPVERPAVSPGVELPPRIQYELQEGKILDYDVIDLPRGRGKLVVLSVHTPSRTPEDALEEAEDVRQWTRVQRRLRGLTAEDEQSDL